MWKPSAIPISSASNANDPGTERNSLKFITRLKTEELRPFILTPVMKSIDLNQSLSYLTEMRQVINIYIYVYI